MVPVPCPARMAALVGLLRLTKKVRLGWALVLPSTGTRMVPLLWPAAMVSVPEVAV